VNDFAEIRSLNSKARLHLALNQSEAALATVEELLPMLHLLDANFRRQESYWTIFRVMRAAGRENESAEALQRAFEYVQSIAERIEDDDLRRGWLEDVPDNPQILAEAEKMGIVH
jgi:hypothetical protein